jgi:hypothetical protein
MFMSKKKFKLIAKISSPNPSVIIPILERIISNNGFLKPTNDGIDINAELNGESARQLNRMLLSELRRVEKKTRIRSEWTSEETTEKFFDYAKKEMAKSKQK